MYRMVYPATVAVDAGDVAAKLSALRYERGQIVGAIAADVAVFQRPAHPGHLEAIREYQRRGTAVVVDLDDDLAVTSGQHPAFGHLHASQKANWHNIKRACQVADLVTVTTPSLADHYGRGRAVVIPNFVPRELLDVTADRDGRTVGWAGVTVTHVGDLTATRGGVAQAIADAGARFLLVGTEASEAQRQLALPEPPAHTGYVDFAAYPSHVARFDVGIVPLLDSRFNRGKSALKGLEYAALGVPFVASPMPDYQRINTAGIGLLARDRDRDWRRQVRQLLADESLRADVAARARQAVADDHLVENNAWRWSEAWQEARERRNGRKAA
jgi:glycosyltransferase involved in cell wall biosynthesis